jgi:hypothetical protein
MSRAGRYVPMHLYDPPPRAAAPPAAGETIIIDDMEGPLNWTGSGTGADWTVALSTGSAHSPSHSLDLTTRQTTPTAGDTVTALFSTTYPAYPRLTLSLWLDPGALLSQGPTDAILRVNAGAHKYSAGLRYDHANAKWYYWDVAGAFQEIVALAGLLAADTWYHVTLVIDLAAHHYVSATLDTVTADLAGIDMEDDGAEVASYCTLALRSSTGAGLPQGAYFDDVVCTAAPNP